MRLGAEIPLEDFNRVLAALRSGKYPQARAQLQSISGFCCLGVMCDVVTPDYKKDAMGFLMGIMPHPENGAKDWVFNLQGDIARRTGKSLFSLNDNHGWSFNRIADFLEDTYRPTLVPS